MFVLAFVLVLCVPLSLSLSLARARALSLSHTGAGAQGARESLATQLRAHGHVSEATLGPG